MRRTHSRRTYGCSGAGLRLRFGARTIGRFAGVAALILWIGCGEKDEGDAPGSAMTQAQRDSAIAESRLPGAGTVGKAIEVADSSEARSNRLDDEYE